MWFFQYFIKCPNYFFITVVLSILTSVWRCTGCHRCCQVILAVSYFQFFLLTLSMWSIWPSDQDNIERSRFSSHFVDKFFSLTSLSFFSFLWPSLLTFCNVLYPPWTWLFMTIINDLNFCNLFNYLRSYFYLCSCKILQSVVCFIYELFVFTFCVLVIFWEIIDDQIISSCISVCIDSHALFCVWNCFLHWLHVIFYLDYIFCKKVTPLLFPFLFLQWLGLLNCPPLCSDQQTCH